MGITITVEEAIMLDAYKCMRKAAKTDITDHELVNKICSMLFEQSMKTLDRLGVE